MLTYSVHTAKLMRIMPKHIFWPISTVSACTWSKTRVRGVV